MIRIKVCFRISTEACDGPKSIVKDVWSYGKFGEK